MNCPTDHSVLQLSERQGIEIDYCPTCRGVWLDRGELDKLIERSSIESTPRSPDRDRDRDRDRGRDRERDRARDDDDDDGRKHKRKKGSFLSEIFEF